MLPGSTDLAYAKGCRCCPDQRISRTRKVADVARINGFCVRRRLPVLPGSMDLAYAEGCRDCGIDCRSALAREDDFDATHLSSGSPRSPASRLLQIRVRGTLPVLPGSTDFAYAEGCGCCPDQWILRTPKVAGVARINGFCVRRRLSVWRGSTVGARLPANAILPQRIYRLDHRVRQQAGSYRFAYFEGCRCCPDQWILRTPKFAGVARINGFRVRQRLRVLPGSTHFAYAEGCRCCPDQWILRTPKAVGIAGSTVGARLPAKAMLMQRICP